MSEDPTCIFRMFGHVVIVTTTSTGVNATVVPYSRKRKPSIELFPNCTYYRVTNVKTSMSQIGVIWLFHQDTKGSSYCHPTLFISSPNSTMGYELYGDMWVGCELAFLRNGYRHKFSVDWQNSAVHLSPNERYLDYQGYYWRADTEANCYIRALTSFSYAYGIPIGRSFLRAQVGKPYNRATILFIIGDEQNPRFVRIPIMIAPNAGTSNTQFYVTVNRKTFNCYLDDNANFIDMQSGMQIATTYQTAA